MTKEEFVRQEISAGTRAHYSRGVWWKSSATGVCVPLLPFQPLLPKESRPKWHYSFIGYSHLVPTGFPAAHHAMYWVLDEPQLRAYGMDSLKYSNRKAVAKAQRSGLTVSRITNLEPLWSDLRDIAVSMAERTGYGLPAEYYAHHLDEWKISFQKEFSKPLREWWGVFSGKKLGAYMYAFLIDDTMHLVSTKVHSDFMPLRASDLLYFSMLEYSRDLPGCNQVNTGRGWQSAGVDRFKKGHGFREIEVGEFFRYNKMLKLMLSPVLYLHRCLSSSAGRLGHEGDSSKGSNLLQRAARIAERIENQEKGL